MKSKNAENLCVHCGQLSGQDSFCCAGCRTAYHLIQSSGLQGFYSQAQIRAPVSSIGSNQFEAFDHPEFLERETKLQDGIRSGRFHVNGLQCAACLWLIEKLPKISPHCLRAEVSFSDQSLFLDWKDGEHHLSQILSQLATLGYEAQPYRISKTKTDQNRTDWIRLGISGASAAASMHIGLLFYAAHKNPMQNQDAQVLGLFSALTSLPALFLGGLPFFRTAWASFRLRVLHPDILVASALILGFVVSVYRTGLGEIDVYYDSLAMIVFLLLIGRTLVSEGSRIKISSHLWQARRVTDKGEERIPRSALAVGDILIIGPQEEIPIDVELIDSEAWIDESVITGEPHSQKKLSGQKILEGCKNDGPSIFGKTICLPNESSLSRLIQRIRQIPIGLAPSKIEQALFLLVIFLVVFVLIVGNEDRFSIALALLIVTCPCALLLSKPLILEKIREEGINTGVLFVNLMKFLGPHRLTEVAFDKTGTLTEGRAIVVREELLVGDTPEHFVSAIYALCLKSHHPLSRAMALHLEKRATERILLTDWKESPGLGIKAKWNDLQLKIAASKLKSETTRLSSAVFVNEAEVLRFEFQDVLRPTWQVCVGEILRDHFKVKILSGDRQDSVTEFAKITGAPWASALGDLKPEDKAKCLSHQSAFVGDGLNDAHSMKVSGLAIGFTGSAESNIGAADVYLMKKDLSLIPEILRVRSRAQWTLQISYSISMIYNILAISLVLLGWVGPLVCAIFMPLSSLSVLAIARTVKMRGRLQNI